MSLTLWLDTQLRVETPVCSAIKRATFSVTPRSLRLSRGAAATGCPRSPDALSRATSIGAERLGDTAAGRVSPPHNHACFKLHEAPLCLSFPPEPKWALIFNWCWRTEIASWEDSTSVIYLRTPQRWSYFGAGREVSVWHLLFFCFFFLFSPRAM